jgi:hypothetical protein
MRALVDEARAIRPVDVGGVDHELLRAGGRREGRDRRARERRDHHVRSVDPVDRRGGHGEHVAELPCRVDVAGNRLWGRQAARDGACLERCPAFVREPVDLRPVRRDAVAEGPGIGFDLQRSAHAGRARVRARCRAAPAVGRIGRRVYALVAAGRDRTAADAVLAIGRATRARSTGGDPLPADARFRGLPIAGKLPRHTLGAVHWGNERVDALRVWQVPLRSVSVVRVGAAGVVTEHGPVRASIRAPVVRRRRRADARREHSVRPAYLDAELGAPGAHTRLGCASGAARQDGARGRTAARGHGSKREEERARSLCMGVTLMRAPRSRRNKRHLNG